MTESRLQLRVAAHSGGGIFGGTEKWTARFMEGLQDRGHRVRLFCRDDAMVEQFAAYGIPVSVGKLGGVAMVTDAMRLAVKLRRFAPDVLLCLTYRKIFLAGLAGRIARVPRVVFRVANQGTYPRDPLYRFAFRHLVHQVLCNADELRIPFLTHARGVDPRTVITVYDGIPSVQSPPDDSLRRTLGLQDVPVIGSVGRLAGQKRYDRLLEVLALLPGTHCLLAGDGPERGPLERLAEALGLADRVHFLGFRSDVATVLAALDVFLLTSDFEGMSNAMLEAMAMGLPVVSTPVSGAREALVPDAPEAAGRVVSASPVALADATRNLLEDERARRALGEAARARYTETFTFDRMLDVWERALGGESLAPLHQGPSSMVLADTVD